MKLSKGKEEVLGYDLDSDSEEVGPGPRLVLSGYSFIRELGSGAFGSVYLMKRKSDGEKVAVKTIKIPNPETEQFVMKEVGYLKAISEPCNLYLACLYNFQKVGGLFILEMEYIPGDELGKFFKKLKGNPNFYNAAFGALGDVSKGLVYLHSKRIIHRDIKPENIIVRGSGASMIPVLVDLGLACMPKSICAVKDATGKYVPKNCCEGRAGSIVFMAPETLLNNEAFYESDMFSLGATIYDCVTGQEIYPLDLNTAEEIQGFARNKNFPKLESPHNMLNTIVNNLLQKDPALRFSATKVAEIVG